MKQTLRSNRLLIRPIVPDDAAFFYELVNSDGWIKYIGDRNIKSHEASREYLKSLQEKDFHFYYVFINRLTNETMGLISFIHRTDENYPDLGFAILPQFGQHGFTFEASDRFLKELRRVRVTNIITGITSLNNSVSGNLLLKLGFTLSEIKKVSNEELCVYILNLTEDDPDT